MVQSVLWATPQRELSVASAVRTVSVYQEYPIRSSVLYTILFACPLCHSLDYRTRREVPGHSNMFLLELEKEVPKAANRRFRIDGDSGGKIFWSGRSR